MGYIDQTLASNEKVLYRAHIHSIIYARIWALFITLVASLAWLAYERFIGTLITSTLLVLSAGLCLYLILPLWVLEMVVTNVRLVKKHGFLRRSTHELELNTIEEVNLRQSMLGRILNYGMLIVRGIGDVDDLIFRNVADPLAFRKEITFAIEQMRERHNSDFLTHAQ
jgi:PH (Pleckstrin Homology) domain-containing protein